MESKANFNYLSSNEICEVIESHPYAPELPIFDDMASLITLQNTLFPNKGFCIGIINHHLMLDGYKFNSLINSNFKFSQGVL